jgi:hypothetical protein
MNNILTVWADLTETSLKICFLNLMPHYSTIWQIQKYFYPCRDSCEVQSHYKNSFLDKPTVIVAKHWVDVPPRQQLNAIMACSFEGYPEKLVWYKNGYNMNGRTYTTVKTIRDDTTGITEFNLLVQHIIHSDYATYSCVGSTPGLGTATGFVHLYGKFIHMCLTVYLLLFRPTQSIGEGTLGGRTF